MRPAQLRRILLIQALETADAEGEILPISDRREATREATGSLTRDSSPSEQGQFVARRAKQLGTWLASHYPAIASALSSPQRLRYLVPVLLVLAILVGWSTQALGAEKRVNILSFPLIGILAWNGLVYLVELYRLIAARLRRSDPGEAPPDGPLARLAATVEALPGRLGHEIPESEMPAVLRLGLSNFQQRWRRLVEPLTWLRIRSALHLAAALLALAAVSGMYAKGIATEYRAYWESTFLEASTVEQILGTLLGPASAISGIPLPEVASLQWTAETSAERNAPPAGDAAPWIHLYAITLGLFIFGPRLALSVVSAVAARTGERRLDPRSLPGAGLYFERLLAEALGTALKVAVLPYCHTLSPTGEAALERDLERLVDAPVTLDWMPGLGLGEEEKGAERLAAGSEALPAHLVLCFDFAATPEQETHGACLCATREGLAATGSETRLHVALDADSFDEVRRSLADHAERREERLQAWRSIAGPSRDHLRVFPAMNS